MGWLGVELAYRFVMAVGLTLGKVVRAAQRKRKEGSKWENTAFLCWRKQTCTGLG